MTTLLQKAFEKASALTADAQAALAKQLLEEIESEVQGDKTLQSSADALADLAQKAVEEHKLGRTRQAGFDEL